MHHKKTLAIVAIIVIAIIASIFVFREQLMSFFLRPTESAIPAGVKPDEATTSITAQNLDTPWAIAHLPNGDLLTTERTGQLRRIGVNGFQQTIDGVRETSEGGLLGLALHPDFANNQLLYVYLTVDKNGTLTNKIERYQLRGDTLQNQTDIITDIPASANHDGGALAFGPDKKLYVTTGDANQSQFAQDTQSLAGKILRLNDNGSVPNDNPFRNPVWSYGHRNPQGITWDDKGQLWSTEHGPSGSATGRDELNLIAKGANYGWPLVSGDETQDALRTPIAQSGDSETWAPGGLAFANGSLFFTGLRGQSLYQAKIDENNNVTLTRHLSEKYGRLRAVSVYKNNLYISTSNRDGRGSPMANDDKIMKLNVSSLTK